MVKIVQTPIMQTGTFLAFPETSPLLTNMPIPPVIYSRCRITSAQLYGDDTWTSPCLQHSPLSPNLISHGVGASARNSFMAKDDIIIIISCFISNAFIAASFFLHVAVVCSLFGTTLPIRALVGGPFWSLVLPRSCFWWTIRLYMSPNGFRWWCFVAVSYPLNVERTIGRPLYVRGSPLWVSTSAVRLMEPSAR